MRRLGAGTVEPLSQDLWEMDRRHWRLKLQPGGTLIANLEWDNSHGGMWCCLCTPKILLQCHRAFNVTKNQGDVMKHHLYIIVSRKQCLPGQYEFMKFFTSFYTLTKTNNTLHFSLRLCCALYLICPYISMFTLHCYRTSTVQALESFSPLLPFSADVHIYHSVDLVSIFTIV